MNKASVHNYADDNSLSCSSNSIPNENKYMIANPKKFQAIVITKNNSEQSVNIKIDGQSIKTQAIVKLLGVTIDDKLKFDEHVGNLCKNASAQLNTLFRFKNYLSLRPKNILKVNSFIYASFNYCPLIWHFSSSTYINKIERVQKRALAFLHDDYESSYSILLLKDSFLNHKTVNI